jgi:hypothetical protein
MNKIVYLIFRTEVSKNNKNLIKWGKDNKYLDIKLIKLVKMYNYWRHV